jgi:hypothetical protein
LWNFWLVKSELPKAFQFPPQNFLIIFLVLFRTRSFCSDFWRSIRPHFHGTIEAYFKIFLITTIIFLLEIFWREGFSGGIHKKLLQLKKNKKNEKNFNLLIDFSQS